MTKEQEGELLRQVAVQIYSNRVSDLIRPADPVTEDAATQLARKAYELAKVFVTVTKETERKPEFQMFFV